jgi:hypothetical protein
MVLIMSLDRVVLASMRNKGAGSGGVVSLLSQLARVTFHTVDNTIKNVIESHSVSLYSFNLHTNLET